MAESPQARRRPRPNDETARSGSPPAKLLRRGSDASDIDDGGLVGYGQSPEEASRALPRTTGSKDAGEQGASTVSNDAQKVAHSGASNLAPVPSVEPVTKASLESLTSANRQDGNSSVSSVVKKHPRLESGRLPPEVEEDAPPHIVARFTSFLRETLKGHNFTALLKTKRDFNNPYYLETVAEAFGIDDISESMQSPWKLCVVRGRAVPFRIERWYMMAR